MKTLILIFLYCLSFSILPNKENPKENEEKREEKKFTRQEFDDALKEALLKEIGRFRPKNMGKLGRELWEKENKLNMKNLGLGSPGRTSDHQ